MGDPDVDGSGTGRRGASGREPHSESQHYPDPDSALVLDSGCERCPALVESRHEIAWGNGTRDADVLVVGEAPGAGSPDAERWRGGNYTGLAYTAGHSGRIVRRLFADAGYGPGNLFVTNAVKCHPDGNRDPTEGELDRCFDHLRAELEAVEPAVVCPTGKHATRTLLRREEKRLNGFLDRVLEPVTCPSLGVTALPLLHPAYQSVWLARLGRDREGYVAELSTRLAALT
jgi:uracil-DNA glycosylase family 4